jgi:branched-chain amino acid transport system substrate-binding protein
MSFPSHRRGLLAALLAGALALPAGAQPEPVKLGLILPMSGPFSSTGRQLEAAVRLFIAHNGSAVGGRKVEVLLRDDAATPAGGNVAGNCACTAAT